MAKFEFSNTCISIVREQKRRKSQQKLRPWKSLRMLVSEVNFNDFTMKRNGSMKKSNQTSEVQSTLQLADTIRD